MKSFLESPIGKILITEEDGFITGVVTVAPDTFLLEESENQAIAKCKSELTEYFEGKRKEFTVPIKLNGTEYRKKVWDALMTVKFGQTATYKDMAVLSGNPNASRAVGGANHNNPVWIIVPCHRIVGANGSLTGYGGGLEAKAWLLEHERRFGNA